MTLGRLGPVDAGPLPFTLEGVRYTLLVPEDGLVAAEWAAVGDWLALVPGALDEDSQDRLYELLGDPRSRVGLRACWKVLHGLAPAVYGVDWWVARRLAATAAEQWLTFSAWSVGVGFDPAHAPAHRVCAGVLAWMRSTAQDEKDMRRIEQQVFAPPPYRSGGRRKSAMPGFSAKEQQAAFQRALAELGSGG